MFLEIQMRAALMGDGLAGATRATLLRVASALGIGALEFAHLEALLRFQAHAGAYGPAGGSGPGRARGRRVRARRGLRGPRRRRKPRATPRSSARTASS